MRSNVHNGTSPTTVGFEQAARALRGGSGFVSDPYAVGAASKPSNNFLLRDDELHSCLKGIVRETVRDDRLSRLGAELECLSEQFCEASGSRGWAHVDLVADLARPLVARAACRLVGIPDRQGAPVTALLDRMMGILEPGLFEPAAITSRRGRPPPPTPHQPCGGRAPRSAATRHSAPPPVGRARLWTRTHEGAWRHAHSRVARSVRESAELPR